MVHENVYSDRRRAAPLSRRSAEPTRTVTNAEAISNQFFNFGQSMNYEGF
jgi:hypothetical protein